MDRKIYCFDIDGTICNNTWGKYEEAEPWMDRINYVNNLYDEGHYIIYMTARGASKWDPSFGVPAGADTKVDFDKMFNFTDNQLKGWGCKYQELRLGKPNADYYVDDRAVTDGHFFSKVCS